MTEPCCVRPPGLWSFIEEPRTLMWITSSRLRSLALLCLQTVAFRSFLEFTTIEWREVESEISHCCARNSSSHPPLNEKDTESSGLQDMYILLEAHTCLRGSREDSAKSFVARGESSLGDAGVLASSGVVKIPRTELPQQQEWSSHGSGGWKSKVEVSAGPALERTGFRLAGGGFSGHRWRRETPSRCACSSKATAPG